VSAILFLAAAASAAEGVPLQAPADSGRQSQTVTGLQAIDLFHIAARAQQAGNAALAEKAYDALAKDPDIEIRTEARFRHAMLLAAMNKQAGAAVLLRAILDEKPNAPRVRLELARMLVQMGDTRAAGRELRSAQAAGLPKEVALVVDQFSLALRSLRPYGGSIEVGLAPDSNVNRATRSETLDTIIAPFQLSDDARAKSGIGFNVNAQGYVRQWLSEKVSLEARVSSRSSLYREKQFDDVLYGGELGLQLRLGRNRIAPSVGRSWRRFGGKAYSVTDTATVNWQHPVGRAGVAEVELSTGTADYRLNDLQDGHIHAASASYERSLSGTLGAALTLSGQRQTARDPAYATWSGGASLLVWKQLGRMSLFASGSVRRLTADARIFLYPERRKEWFTSLSAGATFRQLTLRGFAPLIRVTFERNNSSLTLYDYRRVSTNFGITRAF
jgi:hypothetical protein